MDQSNSITKLRKRLLIVFISIAFLFCLLAGRLFYLQIIEGEFLSSKATDQWYRTLPLDAPRGMIYDEKGEILAGNESVYTVYVRPNAVKDKSAVTELLSETLSLDTVKLSEKLSQNKSEVTIARKVSPEIAESIESAGLSGVYTAAGYTRIYPHGSMLSKVIGFTNIDNEGQNGLEGYYDKYLSGTDGYAYSDADIAGREIEGGTTRYVPAVAGCDMTLTVDAKIQAFAESAVVEASLEWGAKSCSAIVMDVTGGIKAMASYPSYDLNDVPRDDIDLLNLLSKNQLITDVYEPGSTFKIFTTAAGLTHGVTGDNSRYYCSGRNVVDGQRIKCWRTIGHGSQNLAEGVCNSCNVVFMNLALSMGKERLYESLHGFGFGSKTGVDFFGESSGIMMAEESIKNVDLARIGFGQAVAVTPIQLASGVCAAINGGTLYEPYFLEKAVSAEGKVIYEHEPTIKSNPITPEVSAKMRELLVGVVEHGGGSKAKVDGVRVGGKTGTAQKYENGIIASGKYVSSFVGFAPADNPKYVTLFIVDEPSGYTYYGSLTAAPYAGRIFSRIADYEGWEREIDQSVEYVEMPEVTGLSVEEAVVILENAGLEVELVGSGKVLSTTPSAGSRVKKGEVVLVRGEDNADTS